MIEPSFRTLPPLALSRDPYSRSRGRIPQSHYESHHVYTPPDEGTIQDSMDRSGDCMAILPFSRSAFRGSQNIGANKCECNSFFMSPGDPNACLCGHPASCHSPRLSGSEAPSSNESSPYIPPISSSILSPPASIQHSSPQQNSSYLQHQDNALTPVVLARLSQLERLLTSEIQARHLLQENQKYIQLTQQKLSHHCRCLSDEIDLIIGKSGESARESLDLEVLTQKQRKLADDIERIKSVVEGLDERTEDLEFRHDDLEKLMTDKDQKKVGVHGRPNSNGVGSTGELIPDAIRYVRG